MPEEECPRTYEEMIDATVQLDRALRGRVITLL